MSTDKIPVFMKNKNAIVDTTKPEPKTKETKKQKKKKATSRQKSSILMMAYGKLNSTKPKILLKRSRDCASH